MTALLLDHLWQSTLFAAAVGAVVLLLQGNAARVRFLVWFAASAKFLVPFAALAWLGHWLLPPASSVPVLVDWAPAAEPYFAPVASSHALTAAVPTAPAWDWSVLLLAVWALGSLVLVARWLSRWMKLRAALSEADALVSIAGHPVRRAAASLEPGLFGIWRPVIVLPQDIDTRLSAAELEAVLVHEACHRDHRDNLLAAVHMLVEALFWFHPLVWWLGARLNDERERACDEAVLASGQPPEIYAESILKVCKLYVHSPLACVAGVSGGVLKQRIERIVVNAVALPLGLARKLVLAGFAGAALVVPLSAGLLMAPLVQAAQSRPDTVITPERIAVLSSQQAAPRNAISDFNPLEFDRYVGQYQLGASTIEWVSRADSHYFIQLTGQMKVEVFPESPTSFFATVVHAQISFEHDAKGGISGAVLHQNGLERFAPRVSLETAKAVEEALETRVKANKPSPGTEAAIRHQIQSIQAGAQDYAVMVPPLASMARAQWSGTKQAFAAMGPYKSITFKKVAPGGADIYNVSFERGDIEWRIAPLTSNGKIEGMFFRMMP